MAMLVLKEKVLVLRLLCPEGKSRINEHRDLY